MKNKSRLASLGMSGGGESILQRQEAVHIFAFCLCSIHSEI